MTQRLASTCRGFLGLNVYETTSSMRLARANRALRGAEVYCGHNWVNIEYLNNLIALVYPSIRMHFFLLGLL